MAQHSRDIPSFLCCPNERRSSERVDRFSFCVVCRLKLQARERCRRKVETRTMLKATWDMEAEFTKCKEVRHRPFCSISSTPKRIQACPMRDNSIGVWTN